MAPGAAMPAKAKAPVASQGSDPLEGFDADAPPSADEEPTDWSEKQLKDLRDSLRVQLERMGQDEDVSIKAIRVDAVSSRESAADAAWA